MSQLGVSSGGGEVRAGAGEIRKRNPFLFLMERTWGTEKERREQNENPKIFTGTPGRVQLKQGRLADDRALRGKLPCETLRGNRSCLSFERALPLYVSKPACGLSSDNKNDIIQYNLPFSEPPQNFESNPGCC